MGTRITRPYTIIVLAILCIALYPTAHAQQEPYPMRAWVHFSTGSGFEYKSSYQALGPYLELDSQRWLAGDFDGDGRTDLVNVFQYSSVNDPAQARLFLLTDSGFQEQSAMATFAEYWEGQRWLVGDFNGDGRDDLVDVYGADVNGEQTATAWVSLSTGTGFEYQSSFDRLAGFWDRQRWLVGDFNGDGRDDLVDVYGADVDGKETATAWVHLSTGSGFEYRSSVDRLAGFWDTQRWLVGDFNGDGRDDLVDVYGADVNGEQTATAWVHLSTGSGFEYESSSDRLAGFWDRQRWLAGDFNGDGRDDLVDVYGADVEGEETATAWVHLSTGAGFDYRSSVDRLAGFWDSQSWLIGDFNRDGTSDLVDLYRGLIDTPDAPSNVSVQLSPPRSIVITWRDNADNEDGFTLHITGERPYYADDDHTIDIDGPNRESYTLDYVYEEYTYCARLNAYNRGGESLSSNEECVTIPPDVSPPQNGVSQIAVFNCHSQGGSVDLWTYDYSAAMWTDHGTMAAQWANGGCPAGADPFMIPLTNGHTYIFVAVDLSLGGCTLNNPTEQLCQRLIQDNIPGYDNGPFLLLTVN